MYNAIIHSNSLVWARDNTNNCYSDSVSIPTNPRTNRAVGYAFVDLHTKEEAERAITELSGQEVLERKVSVQAARKPGAQTPSGAKDSEVIGGNARGRKVRGKFATRRKPRRGPKVLYLR